MRAVNVGHIGRPLPPLAQQLVGAEPAGQRALQVVECAWWSSILLRAREAFELRVQPGDALGQRLTPGGAERADAARAQRRAAQRLELGADPCVVEYLPPLLNVPRHRRLSHCIVWLLRLIVGSDQWPQPRRQQRQRHRLKQGLPIRRRCCGRDRWWQPLTEELLRLPAQSSEVVHHGSDER
eukprot:scaffold4161_cov101-Isochrysis_galbana.AAC.2